MACVYPEYNKDASLPALQSDAKAGNKGVRADKFRVLPLGTGTPVKKTVSYDPVRHIGPRDGHYHICMRINSTAALVALDWLDHFRPIVPGAVTLWRWRPK